MATIVLPDLPDDDGDPPGLFSSFASASVAASAAGSFHSRTPSFTGSGLPQLPPLRNPFSPDSATTSPVEARSRSGSTSQQQHGQGSAFRARHRHNGSSSGGSSFASSAGLVPNGLPGLATPSAASVPPVPRPPLSSAEAAGELALGYVLENFIEVAERKIGEALGRPWDHDLYLPSVLAEGVDPAFDDLFASIAQISRKLPKAVIDMIMRWRKSQNEGIDVAAVQRSIASAPSPTNAKAIADTLNERKSLASIYILCRVLTVVVNAVDRATLGEDLGAKLEDIIFNSLKNADPLQVQRSANRRANMELYARLIGSLSGIRFVSVTDRFTAELEQVNRAAIAEQVERRVEHIVHGMRFLKLHVYPPEAFEEAAEFAESLAAIFEAASGSRIKNALAVTLVQLLLPVVKGATAEVHHPLWARAMQMMHARANAMAVKPRYVAAALPLICVTLAASPEETLLSNWSAATDLCFKWMKDKVGRPSALNGIIQLLWAYLHRCQESHASVAKRLDPLIRAFFPAGRRPVYPPDCPIEMAACVPHYIAFRHFELGVDTITALFASAASDSAPMDTYAPERLTIGLRAVMRTLDCFERNVDPSLPPSPTDDEGLQALETSTSVACGPLPEAMLARAGLRGLLETVTSAVARIVNVSDRAFQYSTILDDASVLPSNSNGVYSPDRELHITRRHGGFTVSYPRDRQPYFDLQRACFDSWPRCLRAESADFKPVDLLLRALVHVDPDVCASARAALERLAKLGGGLDVVRAAGRFVCRSEFVYREVTTLQLGTTGKLEWLLGTWLTLLDIWLAQLKTVVAPKASASLEAGPPGRQRAGTQSQAAAQPEADIDPRESWSLIADIEAAALVLLCSGPVQLRRQAFEALRLAIALEDLLTEWTTSRGLVVTAISGKRILRVLEMQAHLLVDLDEERVPSQERSRLQRWRKLPDGLVRVGESESAFDFGLWQMTLGSAFAACLEASPVAVEAARPLLAARVLRLYQVSSAAAGLIPSRQPPQTPTSKGAVAPQPAASDNGFLADHWRTHLTALCAITTAPGSADSTSMKSDGQITSGAELIRLIIPFLASEQTGLRDAVVTGLGNVHPALYRNLLDGVQSIVRHLAEDRRVRQQQGPGARRTRRFDRLHTSVARIFELSSRLLRKPEALGPPTESLLGPLLYYVKETVAYLRDPEALEDSAALGMRRAFCNTVRAVTEYCTDQAIVAQWLPPDLQFDLFGLFDVWSFRPLGPTSPEVVRNNRSSDGHGGHATTKSRGSSLGSQPAAFEVYLPATAAVVALCESHGLQVRRDAGDRAGLQVDAQDVLRWAQALFESISGAGHTCARRAVYGLLSGNPTHRQLLDHVVYQCFAEPETLHLQQSTFAVLSDALLAIPDLAVKQSTVFCIALWKMGHGDLPTRQRALDVLAPHLPAAIREETLKHCETALYTSFHGATLQTRRSLATTLAQAHAAEARTVFLELAIRVMQIGCKQTRLLLQLLCPFIVGMRLPGSDRTPSKVPDPVLSNLFLLFARFGDVYHSESRELWTALVESSDGANFRTILRFLVDETVRRGSKEFVRHAQRIVGCLCTEDRAAAVLQELADLVQPTEMLGHNEYESTPLATSTGSSARRTNLDGLYPPMARKLAASPAQAALMLVGDALIGRLSTADPCIPRLMHGLLIQVDHAAPFVRMHARETLVRTLTLLGKLPTPGSALPLPSPVKSKEDGDERSWRSFWEHDDDGIASADAQHTPRQMSSLVADAVRLLEARIPDVRRLWGAVALEWATSCPIRHVACRSFQAFRLLMPAVSQRMLAEMLARLSSTVADESPDVQLFAREIVWTLAAIVRTAEPPSFAELPQLLWACAACLDTGIESEFGEVAKMLEALLLAMEGVPDKTLGPALESCRPPWMSPPGAQVIRVIAQRGMRSATTCGTAFALLRVISTATLAPLIAPHESSLAMLYGVAMVYGLQALEAGKVDADLEAFATRIAKLGEAQGKHNVSRVMLSLAKNRFRTKDDFVRQGTANLSEYFSTSERVDVLVLYLGMLFNSLSWMRTRSLTLIKAFAKQGCLNEGDCESLGPDAVFPLLDLLTSPDHSRAALEIFDEPFPLAKRMFTGQSRPGTSLSRRTDRRRPGTGDSVQQAIFGEPSASGWCMPPIASSGQATRRRLREVVETCGALLGPVSARSESPIAFAIEDFDASSAVLESVASEPDQGDTSTLGDMVDALHDLGSFFEDDAAAGAPKPVLNNGLVRGGPFGDRFGFEGAAATSPAYRMSQALGSASRVAAVLARSLRPGHGPGAGHGASSSASTPRMATIAETSSTPFNAAFAEPLAGSTTPRVGTGGPSSQPLQRFNSEGTFSTASSTSATTRSSSRSRSHHRRQRSGALSSESEGESAWGDEGSSQPASSHENVRLANKALTFTPMGYRAESPSATSDGDDDSLFSLEQSPGHRRRRAPPFLRKRSPRTPTPPVMPPQLGSLVLGQ